MTAYPAPSAVLELLKPITWFPPMWAFACGVVSSGAPIVAHGYTALVGLILAGPLVVAMSQACNDWYDRDVDAINEPQRPIPSGRIPGRWGLYIAVIWTILALLVAGTLGTWVLIAAVVGVVLAWAYSAPPMRLKANGWWGNAACGFSYESLAWMGDSGHAGRQPCAVRQDLGCIEPQNNTTGAGNLLARLWRPHTGTHLRMMVLIYTRSNGRGGDFFSNLSMSTNLFSSDEKIIPWTLL